MTKNWICNLRENRDREYLSYKFNKFLINYKIVKELTMTCILQWNEVNKC